MTADADDWTVSDDDRRRPVSAPSSVGDELAGLVRRRGWHDRLQGVRVFQSWGDIAGPQLAGRCEPVRLAGGTLVVRAESQVWATQLSYMLAALTARAAAVLGAGLVRNVRVVVGPLEGTATASPTSRDRSGPHGPPLGPGR